MEGDEESQGGVSQPALEQEASQQQIVEGATQRSRMSHVTQLPLTRVKNVIKSDPDITLASQEAVILIAKATELFIGYLARKSHVFTVQGKRKTIQRRDIDACIPVHDELSFLEGTLDKSLAMAVRGPVCKTLRRITFHGRHLCSLTGAGSEVSVDDGRVQELLLRMTGMDLDRVFLARKEPLTLPRYKLMDAEQLKEVHAETVSLARELLKMPPVLPERAPHGEVIERDDKLAGAIQHKMIFTDITHHKEDKSRRIVVRELNGILREATWEERDRMCQVYFPKLGRRLWLPAMLERKHLPALLKEDRHLHVLDLTCAQCAPDSADYIRVHKEVYEDIERRGLYDVLRSTRHFGGMVWFLMSRNKVDELLKDMLTRQLVSDASDLVELHLLCYPNSTFATELQNRRERPTGWQLVEAYCIHHQLIVEQELLQAIDHESVEDKTEATLAS